MSATVITLALFAAVLHASWNAFLRAGTDRFWTITVMSLASVVIALPFALALPLPDKAAWPWLALSAVLQTCYSCLLVRAYRQGELGQIYPLVRGSVPLVVTLGGYLFLSEALHPLALLGVGLIASGIMALSTGAARVSAGALTTALITGLFISGYSMVDAIGVRRSGGQPVAYAVWLFILFGLGTWAVFRFARGPLHVRLRDSQTRHALIAGALSMLSYGTVVLAFSLGPAGPIAALRESSVIFAVLIGSVFLGEKLTPRRIFACVVVALGAIALGFGR